jgi:hypothetical protein
LVTDRAFFGVSALFFAGSAALTTLWCTSMSASQEPSAPSRSGQGRFSIARAAGLG